MTNEMIILNARFDLVRDGKIGTTGQILLVEDDKGNKIEIEEPEEIHTYAGWKELNRQVKKGATAIASFPIWKHCIKKSKNENEAQKEMVFLKNAFWFKYDQTEEIKK